MYKIVKWDPELDLEDFYQEAGNRGFENNSSQAAMIDCFYNEPEWAAWILYKEGRAIGSVAAHTFDIMGPNSYRVLARTCTFGDARPNRGLITTKRLIAEHQNLTDQFLLPVCIEWAGCDKNLYATSNDSHVASQRLVHNHYFPTLAKLGIVEWVCDVSYRFTDQSVWRINVDAFETNLNKYPRWI
jgi:hypothetical protein